MELNTNKRQQGIPAGSMAVAAGLLAVAGLLSGCGMAGSIGSSPVGGGSTSLGSGAILGTIYGGQQPVAGSTVQLYTVGTTGMKTAATAIGTPVTSDANGNFSLSGTYTCSGATQVYVMATGGDAGAGPNSAIREAAAVGSCATLQANASHTFLMINEMTTVAAAYALSPFASDSLHVGAAGSNPTGLVNAVSNALSLVHSSVGVAGGTLLPAGATVPAAELNTLGDILAACVNTNGPSSTQCTTLLNATGTSNTFDAAFAIARTPAAATTTGLFSLVSGTAPFQPTLTTRPSDFSVAITYNAGGGLAAPFGIALDASGDAFISNEGGTSVVELSPTGSLLTSLSATGMYGPQGVAVDRSGNLWVANTAGNSVVKFPLSGNTYGAGTAFTAGGIMAPTAVALDSAGNAFVTNFNGNSVTGLTNAGTVLSGSPFTGNGGIVQPSSIAVGSDGSVYVASASGTAVKLTNAGAYVATLTDNALQGADSIAVDAAGHIALTGYVTGASQSGGMNEFTTAGAATFAAPLTAELVNPGASASDGTSVWVTNNTAGGGVVQYAFGAATPTSPSNGFGSLNGAMGVAVDASGSLWTANSGSNTVSHFIGLAVPVATPLAANVGP